MFVSKFEVSNFRSITDSQKIELNQYNVIIGVNNIGKSNLINALVLALNLVKESSYSKFIRGSRLGTIRNDRIQYNRDRDFPLNEKNGERKNTIFRITFELNDNEKEELYTKYDINVTKELTLRFLFDSNNWGQYDVIMRGIANKKFNANKHNIAKYIADKFNPIYIPCIRDTAMSEKAFELGLKQRLKDLYNDEEYMNCLNILTQKQDRVIHNYQNEIKDIVSKYIPEVNEITYSFRGDVSSPRLLDGKIYINDGVNTMLELKGDGIKSLTAIALYSNNSKIDSNSVLCIEEPESHLHADAIYGIKKILSETSKNTQVIITTHSALFIDKKCISNNIIVSQNSIHRAKNLREIKDMLGIHVSDEYLSNELVVIVEGQSDEKFLSSLLRKHSKYDGWLENEKIKIVNMRGGAKASYFLSFYNSLMISSFVVLDNDVCGQNEIKNILDKGLAERNDVFILSCADRKYSELEDFVILDKYEEYVKENYSVNLKISKSFMSGKEEWSSRLKKAFSEQGQGDLSKNDEDNIKSYIAHIVEEEGFQALYPQRRETIALLLDKIIEKIQ